jgi:hypothetical protein
MMSNQAYDIAKKAALIWLPALGALYFGLAQIWNLPNAEQVVGSITVIDTFLGVVLGISSSSYNNSDAPYDGNILIKDVPMEDGSTKKIFGLEFDEEPNPERLAALDKITFKVKDQTVNGEFWDH